MSSIQIKITLFISMIFLLPQVGSAQGNVTNELRYEVNKIYPYISISRDRLKEANNLTDFKNEVLGNNLQYNPSWVSEFISVEISTSHQGMIKVAKSKSDQLTPEQRDLMIKADLGKAISVKVQYIPKNSLTNNDIQEINYSFSVRPDIDAEYTGGEQVLNHYLAEKAMNKIPSKSFEGYDLTAVKFTISEEGHVADVHVFGLEFQTSKNEKINALLLETVRSMPCWEPAAFSDGTKVKQEFVLTVGNMENCTVNLLNILRD